MEIQNKNLMNKNLSTVDKKKLQISSKNENDLNENMKPYCSSFFKRSLNHSFATIGELNINHSIIRKRKTLANYDTKALKKETSNILQKDKSPKKIRNPLKVNVINHKYNDLENEAHNQHSIFPSTSNKFAIMNSKNNGIKPIFK